jgi:UDP-N-acetylglucosamine--N-acetylmuramyl-(pentapeptide) pyrophosphoryl-undecaprenol N-acetylglucosamine transferase
VVITGGGLGAKRINDAAAQSLDQLLPVSSVILISGAGQYDQLRATTPHNDPRFQLYSFVSKDMALMLGAADLVVTRAGATTILELAALAKPTLLIPNGYLTGGHQLKNAAAYAENGAVAVLEEEAMMASSTLFASTVLELLADPVKTNRMSKAFHEFAKPQAAADMADMIVLAAKK